MSRQKFQLRIKDFEFNLRELAASIVLIAVAVHHAMRSQNKCNP